MSAAWVVRATEVGFDFFTTHRLLALNCLVRRDVRGLAREQVVRAGPSARLGAQLARLLDVAPGDLLLATDSARREDVLIGTAAGTYRYDPELDPEHPHVVDVEWLGRRPRAAVVAAGVVIPGIAVTAIGPLHLPAETRAELASAPLRDPHVAPRVARPRAAGRHAPAPAPAPPSEGRECGADVLASLPRRSSGPVSWRDPVPEPPVPCDHPSSRCRQHTQHRYWLEVELRQPDPRGPNVLVVGANPTCPDRPALNNTTYDRVRRLGDELGAASLGMVNLATRRTAGVAGLRQVPAEERVGPRQPEVLREALARADLVVLATGSEITALLPDQVSALSALLREEVARGLVVVEPVGLPTTHPMRWPTARRADGHSTLWHSLCRWPAQARTALGSALRPSRRAQ